MIRKLIGAGIAMLAFVAPAAEAATLKVVSSSVHLRSGPGTGYDILTTLSQGTVVRVESISGSWSRISSPRSGYVYSSYLSSGTKATVNVGTLNVRSGPGTNYSIVSTLSKGAVVYVVAASGSWKRIGSPIGWVYGSYVTTGTYVPPTTTTTTDKGALIVKYALTRVGDPYSQALRGTGSYVDCSYLVWWAIHKAGISWFSLSTAAEEMRQCVSKGVIVSASQRKPGDLIFWRKTTCHCGRYCEIHHIGIYIGNGKVCEAVPPRVVVRNVWSSSTWSIYGYARPAMK